MSTRFLFAVLCGAVAATAYVAVAQALTRRTSSAMSNSASKVSQSENQPVQSNDGGKRAVNGKAGAESEVEYVYLRKADRIRTISHGDMVDLEGHLANSGKTIIEFTAPW